MNDSTSELEVMTPSLVLRLRSGDPTAVELLNSLYRDALMRYCLGYLHRMEEAEDAVQDICHKVLSTTTPVPELFRPWLYRIARNHCLNRLRSTDRRKDRAQLPQESQVHEMITGHLTRLVHSEQRSRLSELVASLSDVQQEVLRLRYVEGLARTEIAEVLDTTESVVKSRLFEALKQLREHASCLEDSDR